MKKDTLNKIQYVHVPVHIGLCIVNVYATCTSYNDLVFNANNVSVLCVPKNSEMFIFQETFLCVKGYFKKKTFSFTQSPCVLIP